MTEEQALRHLKRGSQAALEWFIDRYGGYVTAIIRGIIGQSMTVADVEEAASDVFLASGTAQGGYTAARRRPIWPPPPATVPGTSCGS